MDIRQLNYFIKAAEFQNFTKASKAACIAESSLSVQIKQLETELGVELFIREKKRVTLSEAGKKLLPHARMVIADIKEAATAVQDINEMRSGSLRIGGIFSLCSLLTDTLVPFSIKYPSIHVKIVSKSGKRLFEMLHANELDFVLTFDSPVRDPRLDRIELFESPLTVIAHKDHPIAKYDQISLDALTEYPLALPESGMHVRDILEERFPEIIQTLNTQLELNDVNILYQLVCTKHWISIMPRSIQKDHNRIKAIKLSEKNTNMTAAVYWKKGGYRKKTVEVFMKMFEDHLNDSAVLYRYRNEIFE
ncbi:LysR family transcriptional regulator [Parabacteroides sp. PF5-9]|uniref:LysR family transcriptional regulator n=1 Tax=Parabacteroides sp. PF5-9 TaxID=1742404 RepID=UPI002473DFF9|nr:LysR family transcriptional regulator [Parabacteroides sp. PF5-9]MDH6357364.1 LysR family cyn operon transcriptional activator [Parabacteroides sp. PF5-9]